MNPNGRGYPEFITITCLEWKYLLEDDCFKEIVIDSLRYLTRVGRVAVYGFVIMSNHMHLVWHMLGDHQREEVQRDFLKFTAKKILKLLRDADSPMLRSIRVDAKDRKYQVWERNSRSMPLVATPLIFQKLNYIHNNPVKAKMVSVAVDYKYSSARLYWQDKNEWDFLERIFA